MDAFAPITFFVVGQPKTAGSKKFVGIAKTTGRPILVDDAKNTDWKNAVALAASAAHPGKPLVGPISLTIRFQLLRPRGHYRSGRNAGQVRETAPAAPIVKPDLTKMVRCLEDSLRGILWRDDAQVVEQQVRKTYSDRLGAQVTVSRPDWCRRVLQTEGDA